MKVFLVCALVLVAVGAVKSAPPRKAKFCCFPPQYEASQSEVAGYALPTPPGKALVVTSISHLAADSTNERAGADLTQIANGKTTKLKIIINYKEKVQYVINGQTCTKAAMNTPQFQCIPDNAQVAGPFYFGDKKLFTNTYSFPLKDGFFEGNVSVTVTQDKCIPVSTVSIGHITSESPAPSIPVLKNFGYFNFTIGIKDPNHWFTLPSFCPREISEVSERSVDSNPVSGFMTFSNVMMGSTTDE